MIWSDSKFPDGSTMLLGRITLVAFPVVLRIFFCKRIHVIITIGLGKDAGSCNRQILAVTLYDGCIRQILVGFEAVTIHDNCLRTNLELVQGTVRDNLLMGKPSASEDELWAVLERVNLAAFLKSEKGLDTPLLEKASNLSGGQCQRLALARALLHDSPIYIFDEATSNIDIESENNIMAAIHKLAKHKTVLLISHRLANVIQSDNIYVLENGRIAESGSHTELLQNHGLYERLWNAQQSLENYGKEGDAR